LAGAVPEIAIGTGKVFSLGKGAAFTARVLFHAYKKQKAL
jgi:hypothetical protein